MSPSRDSLELASLASSSGPDGAVSEVSSRASISSSRRLSPADDDDDDARDDGPSAASPRDRDRSYSISSAFNYAGNLFPLTSSTGAGGSGARYAPLGAPTHPGEFELGGSASLEKMKSLTYLNGLSLIVGLIIGSGIFSSPSQVSDKVGSPGAALIVWVVAGVLAWTGAASYAELGGAIPLNGGAQVYLAKVFGEMAGFLFSWVALLVLKPGSSAIIAIVMGEYLVRAVVGADAEAVGPWINKGVALAGIALVTLLNCLSTRLSTRVNDALMFLKFVALVAVAVIGIVVAATGYSFNGHQPNSEWRSHHYWFRGTSYDPSNWAMALYAGLWAFDGWDNTNYVVGEFRNPGRDLPRVIHSAMPLVILSYLLANVAYFLVLPIATINSTNTVVVMFGSHVFGPVGSLLFALVVSASCFGALNSSTFTSGRLVYVAAKEGYIPAVFCRIGLHDSTHHRQNQHQHQLLHLHHHGWLSRRMRGLFYTPVYALVLNALLTAAYCVVGEFGTLLTFYGVAGYTFYFIAVLGLIILRIKEPNLDRPYKTWIVTPIVFSCVSLFLLSKALFAQPLQTLIVVSFVLAGIPVYFWRIRGRDDVVLVRRSDPSAQSDKPWWRFW